MSNPLSKIQVFIFSWNKTTDNAIKLYNSITKHNSNCIIINCDEGRDLKEHPHIKTIQLDDRYYFGGQFQTALKHLDKGNFYMNVVADMTDDVDWKNLFGRAINSFNKYKIGVYAPHDVVSGHGSRGKVLDGDLYHVLNTDCTCWIVRPNIIDKVRGIDYFNISNLGWGIDVIVCSESIKQGYHVIRDYSIRVTQPKGNTGYRGDIARKQMKNLIEYYGNKK